MNWWTALEPKPGDCGDKTGGQEWKWNRTGSVRERVNTERKEKKMRCWRSGWSWENVVQKREIKDKITILYERVVTCVNGNKYL